MNNASADYQSKQQILLQNQQKKEYVREFHLLHHFHTTERTELFPPPKRQENESASNDGVFCDAKRRPTS
jgi:hypothetical protein